ncbi:MAG: DUF504 domain-containing protein [Candidatus Odinarchaeia archaeon]
MKMRLRDILNKLMWHVGLENYNIVILHRGAPEDKKTIPGSKIKSVKSSYFTYIEHETEVVIPFHRIIEIRSNDGEILWRSRRL